MSKQKERKKWENKYGDIRRDEMGERWENRERKMRRKRDRHKKREMRERKRWNERDEREKDMKWGEMRRDGILVILDYQLMVNSING